MKALLYGFIMHIAQIVAIGPQNIFVLTNSYRHKIVIPVVCILLDCIMIFCMTFGVMSAFAKNIYVLQCIRVCGVIFLLKYGISAFHRAIYKSESLDAVQKPIEKYIILNTIFISIFNPGVWIDTVTISTISLEYDGVSRWLFYLGNVASSIVWFAAIGFLGYIFGKFLQSAKVWRYINFGTGIVMVFMAIKLIFN
ncbi:LysE/ArgO family amino acid transporter [Candidatus Deianiraea vastatrix]|uniref:Amino acid transporter n=1 Tax=Candidatus Deianiraea vastatrix TaxID=2163644 RepID=A0A5B8XHZ8_9RICK|nr:LysE family transporter [Candidatus Deianiraea vastatrix]QED23664.1 Putative amino acid transporter [Candidatus Deianiraea vastatrix]